jgi:hypothetical protein
MNSTRRQGTGHLHGDVSPYDDTTLSPALPARGHCMDDFAIAPPLVVKDTPKPRHIASLAQARAYVDEALRLGRPPAWRELYARLHAVTSEEDAEEAVGALRELLELEDLLVPPDLPLERPPER